MQRLKIILQSKIFIILSLLIMIFYCVFSTKVIRYHSKYSLKTSAIEGQVLNYHFDGDKLSFTIAALEKLPVTYYFKSLEEKEYYQKNFKLGIIVKVEGNLNIPSNNTIPNTFNYQKYLYNKKIFYTFNASSIRVKNNHPHFLYHLKNVIYQRTTNFKNISPYMQAFIIGDKNNIDSDIYSNFRNNGVTHLFAVSGMHVSFLVLTIEKILIKLHFKEKKKNIIIITFLCFYMFLIGFSASVVRASFLYLFLLINKKFNFNLPSIRVLYLLLLILILINPFYIYDLGFIYSFLTSMGLIIFSKKIEGTYFESLFLTSLIAFIFSLPVTLANFYEFNLLTILNNLLIVPLVSLILFPLTLITFFIPPLAIFLSFGFQLLEGINTFCNNLSIMITVPKINVIFIITYYLIIYLILKKGFKYTSLLVILILIHKCLPMLDSNAYIYYLDVGQGDSTLIISEQRRDIILIDTGGKITYEKEEWQKRNSEYNLGTNIVQFLKSLGLTKINLLICTHGDIDHIGYASTILKEIKVEKVMLNNNSQNSFEKDLFQKVSNSFKNEYHGQKITIKNLNDSITSDENTSSLVLYTTLKNKKLLFMGDASQEVELNIIAKYQIQADVLKLGHHGSKTSSNFAFVKQVNPSLGIISAGRNNRYNHPSKETISTLNKLKIPYLNTMELGTIKYTISKNNAKLNFYPP